MANIEDKTKLKKKEIKRELKQEKNKVNKKYKDRRKGSTTAVVLVLIAVVLLIVAKNGEEPSKNMITITGTKIVFEDKKYTDVESLKNKLLEKEYTDENYIVLVDNKAKRTTYEDVKNLLEQMNNIQFVEK